MCFILLNLLWPTLVCQCLIARWRYQLCLCYGFCCSRYVITLLLFTQLGFCCVYIVFIGASIKSVSVFFSLLCFGLMEKGGLFKMMVVWCKHDLKSLPLIKCSSFVQKKMHQTENDTYPACHIICIQMSQQTQKKCTRTVFLCWKLQACNLSSLAIFSLFLFIGISWSKKPLSAGICFVVLCLCDGF